MTLDNFADERDFKLLEKDKYTFFVLRRILTLPCELILSDHKRIIICFSLSPHPVWIWTADDADEDEMERAYQLAGENGFLDGRHTFKLMQKTLRPAVLSVTIWAGFSSRLREGVRLESMTAVFLHAGLMQRAVSAIIAKSIFEPFYKRFFLTGFKSDFLVELVGFCFGNSAFKKNLVAVS